MGLRFETQREIALSYYEVEEAVVVASKSLDGLVMSFAGNSGPLRSLPRKSVIVCHCDVKAISLEASTSAFLSSCTKPLDYSAGADLQANLPAQVRRTVI